MHNFPIRPIIMKPNEQGREGHNEWKQQVLVELFPTVQGIIDDNAGLIDALPHDYQGTIFLFGHDTYGRDTNINVVACKDWPAVKTHMHSKQEHIQKL